MCKEPFPTERARCVSYHWTETRQQLTQWDSEGPNYCPYHLHNYNVFLKQQQYRNCKLYSGPTVSSLVEVIFRWRAPALVARQPGSGERSQSDSLTHTAYSIGFKKPTVWRNESFAPQIIWNYISGCLWRGSQWHTQKPTGSSYFCVFY